MVGLYSCNWKLFILFNKILISEYFRITEKLQNSTEFAVSSKMNRLHLSKLRNQHFYITVKIQTLFGHHQFFH